MQKGEYLKLIRSNAKLTATELGVITGYSQSHISSIENCNRKISKKASERILKALSKDEEEYQLLLYSYHNLEEENIYLPEVVDYEKEKMLEDLFRSKKAIERCIEYLKK